MTNNPDLVERGGGANEETRGHYFWMGSCGSCNEMTKRVVR